MRVLITGSSGQIGTNLGQALLGLGHSVAGLDNRPNPWTSAFPTQLVDLSQTLPAQRGALGAVEVGAVDAVVHLAAHAKVHALVERPLGALENHQMVTNALEFARVNGVPIILASSREVYGNLTTGQPVPESAADFRLAPSPYAAMKLAGESLAAAYRRCYGLSFAVVRFSNVYGRHDNDLQRLERAIWIFRQNILAARPVTIFGATKTLDFTYVDDAVAGLVSCLERLVAREDMVVGETFNLAFGEGHRLVDVVTLIADALGKRAEMQLRDARPGEVTWYVADLTKARRALAYRPRVPVQEGIRRAMRWAQEVEEARVEEARVEQSPRTG
ncbi:MAG: NAD-dependent epimerase/dehydratase family protein [Chloroflexota bacterium]|nr:NAD-dependent epimerase/dehydratase family protein [Chloroflexota bacterium]